MESFRARPAPKRRPASAHPAAEAPRKLTVSHTLYLYLAHALTLTHSTAERYYTDALLLLVSSSCVAKLVDGNGPQAPPIPPFTMR